jgi:hypothetical protein
MARSTSTELRYAVKVTRLACLAAARLLIAQRGGRC